MLFLMLIVFSAIYPKKKNSNGETDLLNFVVVVISNDVDTYLYQRKNS